MKPSIELIEKEGFTPLDCKWCYWENHVTTDESCVCLFEACKTGDPRKAFALAVDYEEGSGCPCDDFAELREGEDDDGVSD